MNGIGKAGMSVVLSLGLVAATSYGAAAQVAGADAAAADPRITIDLEGAAVGGEAVLTSAENQTEVAIELTGATAESTLAGFLVSGMCTEGGEVIADLGSVEVNAAGEGQLRAELPIDLATLASAPVAVEVRPTDAAESVAVACGQHLAVSDTDVTPPAAENAPQPLPEPAPAPEASVDAETSVEAEANAEAEADAPTLPEPLGDATAEPAADSEPMPMPMPE